jgi:hypothetical protein
MIATCTAELLQISGMISWLVRNAQRSVLGSHLIEYTPLRPR